MTAGAPSGPPAWFRGLAAARIVAGAPPEATAICHDSRRVTPGAIFVAVPGIASDGNAFIPAAIDAGAAAVVVQEDRREAWEPHVREGVAFVAVPDARRALAEAAAAFHGYPARALGTVGVTGTDGKTTTTHLIAHILNAAGRRAGYLSSVAFATSRGAELNASHMTTLEAPDVQRRLVGIRDAGDAYAVVEASSHGLSLHRVDCCEFDVAVFTNLAPDHLDFHGEMDAYREAKAVLFRMAAASVDKGFPKAAILNSDDAASAAIGAAAGALPRLTYGLRESADLIADNVAQDGFATTFSALMRRDTLPARVPLLGAYNVANCLAAVAVACSQAVAFADAVPALESFPGVPGRMEMIEEGQPFRVVVDIASTEQAMRNVLSMLRPLTDGRLIVVFGAAGERDTARRSGLARAVAESADRAVVTNEDPRSEDPDAIIGEVAAALDAAGFAGRYEREPDRRTAIGGAFGDASRGDTVLLAGKGTEQSMVFADREEPWDERAVARELLGAHDASSAAETSSPRRRDGALAPSGSHSTQQGSERAS